MRDKRGMRGKQAGPLACPTLCFVMTHDSPRMLTSRDVARRMAVTPATVRRWAREGLVPSHRIAGPRAPFRFDEHELEAAVKAENESKETP